MNPASQDPVERFRKRVERTQEHTLHRNLRAGVYGPPGSARRAVAERALELRQAELAETLRAASAEERAEITAAARRAVRASKLALTTAIGAALMALLAAARSFGVF